MQSQGATVVLGSGGARGLAHIGALSALDELGVPIKAIVGCSIGAKIGAFYAAGITPSQMQNQARQTTWWQQAKLFWPDFSKSGITAGKRIEKFLYKHLGHRHIETFGIQFVCVATDLGTGEQVVLNTGHAVSAVRASISMPFMLAPVIIDGRMLVDGAISNPLPVSIARTHCQGPIIAIQAHGTEFVQPHARDTSANRNMIQVYRRTGCLMQWNIAQAQLRENPPDLLIAPYAPGIDTFDFHKADISLAVGYDAVMTRAPEIIKLVAHKRHPAITGHSR
ncbi:patatin-like phospholipase family protein [Acidithiobacillus ferrivorans]|nr:patatin-like phospholipase family protein [Acidithiobacillus ferrivorans]